jgi:hypothetical protein
MKRITLMVGICSLFIAACTQEKASTDLNNASFTSTETVETDGTELENQHREQATRMSSRMATEMQMDTSTQARVEQAYMDRQRKVDKVKKKYEYEKQSNVRTGGSTPESDENDSRMATELKTIDAETDNILRDILSPVQYTMYETNRASYWADNNPDLPKRQITKDGDEIKVKLGDIKATAEPGESKVVTPKYESKIVGEKRTFKAKSEDVEIKSEPGKFKYEADNAKVKMKAKE